MLSRLIEATTFHLILVVERTNSRHRATKNLILLSENAGMYQEKPYAFKTMDALRGIISIAVVASHVRNMLIVNYEGQGDGQIFYFVTGYGHAGVVLFFVLSGFWITKSVVRRSSEQGFWRVYLVDRLARLWVVLIPALVFGGLLDFLGSRILQAPLYNGRSGAESLAQGITLAPKVFLANLLFLQSLAAPVYGSNGPLWSLAYEFWFYLWFPAIWLLIRYCRPTWTIITLLLAFIYPGLTTGFATWLCGALLFGASQRWSDGVGEHRIAVPLLVIAFGLFVVTLIITRMHPWAVMDFALATSFSIMLFAIIATNFRPVGLALLARFGAEASFSLYAIHFPIAALASALLAPGGRLEYSSYGMLIVVIVISISIVVAIGFASCTEAHTAAIRRKFRYARALTV